jgi:hypothetical protein
VPSLQTYSDHSIDKHARLREQSRGRGTGTRSLPALGPAAAVAALSGKNDRARYFLCEVAKAVDGVVQKTYSAQAPKIEIFAI